MQRSARRWSKGKRGRRHRWKASLSTLTPTRIAHLRMAGDPRNHSQVKLLPMGVTEPYYQRTPAALTLHLRLLPALEKTDETHLRRRGQFLLLNALGRSPVGLIPRKVFRMSTTSHLPCLSIRNHRDRRRCLFLEFMPAIVAMSCQWVTPLRLQPRNPRKFLQWQFKASIVYGRSSLRSRVSNRRKRHLRVPLVMVTPLPFLHPHHLPRLHPSC